MIAKQVIRNRPPRSRITVESPQKKYSVFFPAITVNDRLSHRLSVTRRDIIDGKKIANVEGRLEASFLTSFENAGGRRLDTDKLLIRLDG